ncbi:hypothetical protein OG252_00200 [Streptomyces sp. NBC_01352]|uniref:hypothetical protein n=1 Tax=unclassified Streptomyces TaxID=2593676 RepID=UPI0022544ED4|nr:MULTISPECIES: hypothetical protein [unclassified Streptomyces]MCX4706991.1 hypothetical protein [Streptomyces sp. NBC_01373]
MASDDRRRLGQEVLDPAHPVRLQAVTAPQLGVLNQRFLGRLSTFGDDRHTTNYCLLTGKAVLQANAVAWTLVPENVRHYLRQQVRWNKSFFRESLWIIRVGKILQARHTST